MLTHDERTFVAANLAGLALGGVSMFLIVQGAMIRTTDTFYRYFWICSAWAVILVVLLFIRTRRKGLWSRLVDAEASLRQRFGFSGEPLRGDRWFPVVAAVSVVVYLLMAVASGWTFLYFRE